MDKNIQELMQRVLALKNEDAEALFIATGVVLAERNPERLSSIVEDCIVKETILSKKQGPGASHIFALALWLAFEKVSNRIKVEQWCNTEENKQNIEKFGIWNKQLLEGGDS
jgi:hypothetical protein